VGHYADCADPGFRRLAAVHRGGERWWAADNGRKLRFVTQSRTLEKILREAKRLRPVDRRKLIRALEGDPPQPAASGRAAAQSALARFVARAGSGHSTFTDVSGDKYKHLGDAYADTRE
jgi:hypothetical protein